MTCLCDCIPSISQAIFTLVAFVVGKFLWGMVRSQCRGCCKKEPTVHKSDWKKDTVYLYQFPRAPTVPNLSPFCLKVETWLRANKIPYEVVESFRLRSKNGLMPFVELNGRQIADSQLIIFELEKHFRVTEQSKISPERAGIARAIDRMIEGSTFYTLIYTKVYKNTAKFVQANITGGPFPSFLRTLFSLVFKKMVKGRLNSQGYGKFDEADVQEVLRRDLEAINDVLGDKKYIGGDNPCIADFTIFGHLATCEFIPMEQPVKDLIGREFPKIKELLQRIQEAYWQDWDAPKNSSN